MYFVTADQPEGPWSTPTKIQVPSGMSGLGVDNSIFIDDETGKWYLLTKAGHENNHLVELGENGQPTGVVLDLTWLNPNSAGNPYGWAEGPVMWKYNGYYYYSFAQHLVGEQYVMRSDTLSDDESAWTIVGENIFTGSRGTYNRPNHISPVVMLEDSTSWTIAHSYHSSANWYAHGRQGLLCQVIYNDQGFPIIQYPSDVAVQAPDLPSSGIPWMVPKSDMFNTSKLNSEWSFLGYTPQGTYSLDVREGWLYLEPYGGSNTVIQNDGEHCYSLITRVDFEPKSTSDEAGLWIMNGPETLQAKVFSTINSEGKTMLACSFNNTKYEAENTIGSIVWLKLQRNEHMITGFYSANGISWTQIGEPINAVELDREQTQFNNFTGNQQGLYVQGELAYFDLYVYKDAYTAIMADSPANQYGTSRIYTQPGYVLGNIHANDWAMYAGVEFGGNDDYKRTPDSLEITAASASSGGIVEVWLDSIDTGNKISECTIENTGSWTDFRTFKAVTDPVYGRHDVYLKFSGSGTSKLFRINSFRFFSDSNVPNSIGYNSGKKNVIKKFQLYQNYPNPFNPKTLIQYSFPKNGQVSLKVYDLSGTEIATLIEGIQQAGNHFVIFDGSNLASGVYFYQLKTDQLIQTKKLILLK